jgi:hypothetical protein
MQPERRQLTPERRKELEIIQTAARDAVREALHRHMLLGESVAAADDHGGVRVLGPEEIREVLN